MFERAWLCRGLVFWFVFCWIEGHVARAGSKKSEDKVFTNGWAIHIHGGLEKAQEIAKQHGFDTVEPIGSLDGYYHLTHPHHPARSRRSADDRTEQLRLHPHVRWVEQQHEKERVKRGHFHDQMVARGITPRYSDPLWDAQWYLDDKRKDKDLDIHVIPIWNHGISGKGVVVTILDDGIEHNHTDLVKNYDPNASWDVNDGDSDPFPRYDPTNENKHGTRCAGEVAAQANNTKCGVGVAYNAKIGGVRMLDGRVTDKVEAESLSLNPQYIDIYSASWGPSDDGATVEGPGTLATAAFLNGIEKGRGGLGSIFVWASGNGGRHGDSCNCDGYTDSIYTLSISSASDHGESPWYSESCSSTLATTFSSGAHGEKRIVTTDLHDTCTERHTGTSASAPLAAGIIALALECNPKITWRDIQHIVVHTSNYLPLKHDQEWSENGIKLMVNRKFGFGLLVADKIVNMAKTFVTVPEKQWCRGQINQDVKEFKYDKTLTVQLPATGCNATRDEIRYLEHVQLLISLDYTSRGDLAIYLTSPMGTKSCLLSPRQEDTSNEGFSKWPFMTTHSWGEDPRGVWTLEIKDLGDNKANHGALREWQLILHGTKEKPHHQKITHPDAPRSQIPVPVSRDLGFSRSEVPSGPTYTFGPAPKQRPGGYASYIAPSLTPYNPPAPPKSLQAVLPAPLIPKPLLQKPALLETPAQYTGNPAPRTHVVVAQVQRINPVVHAQVPARLQAMMGQGPAHASTALQNLPSQALQRVFRPQRPLPALVQRPANYMAVQAPRYFAPVPYRPRIGPNPMRSPYAGMQNRMSYPMRWENVLYNHRTMRLKPFNYIRTFGRRGASKESSRESSRPNQNRLARLRKKWRKKHDS